MWHPLKGCKGSDFLFPVAAMSPKFRGRFMALVTRRLRQKGVVLDQAVRKQCFAKNWVVNSRPPAKGVTQVLEYIGRYAYRVAITNSRILSLTDQDIAYDYKMYRKGGRHGVMHMSIDTFLQLFSQHILPDAFLQIVKDAAQDARVHLRQIEYRTQGRDHPILPASPETQYLKCGIFQIWR